jgi:hypothetical protein
MEMVPFAIDGRSFNETSFYKMLSLNETSFYKLLSLSSCTMTQKAYAKFIVFLSLCMQLFTRSTMDPPLLNHAKCLMYSSNADTNHDRK